MDRWMDGWMDGWKKPRTDPSCTRLGSGPGPIVYMHIAK
jgi:hypothetical protein